MCFHYILSGNISRKWHSPVRSTQIYYTRVAWIEMIKFNTLIYLIGRFRCEKKAMWFSVRLVYIWRYFEKLLKCQFFLTFGDATWFDREEKKNFCNLVRTIIMLAEFEQKTHSILQAQMQCQQNIFAVHSQWHYCVRKPMVEK